MAIPFLGGLYRILPGHKKTPAFPLSRERRVIGTPAVEARLPSIVTSALIMRRAACLRHLAEQHPGPCARCGRVHNGKCAGAFSVSPGNGAAIRLAKLTLEVLPIELVQ